MTFRHFLPTALTAMLFGWGAIAITASAQNVDLKKYPDYRPFDPSLERTMPTPASNGAARSGSATTRPDHVNNALSIFYPPVFNQSGGSCGSAQAIGYIFTHDMNNMRNTDASLPENRYATHFIWLFTDISGKMEMGMNYGVMSEADYGGQTCSSLFGYQETIDYYFGWPTGYKKWFDAMHNRIKGFMYGPIFRQ